MNKKVIIGVGIELLLLVAIGFTYAYFTSGVTGEGTDQVVTTGTLSLVYKDGQEITLDSAYPGDSVEKVFTVTNTGTLDTEYSINFTNLINTITNEELVVSYTCTSYTDYVDQDNKGEISGTCEGITNQVIEETEEAISSIITNNISIASNITHEYTLTITFIETNEAQDYNQGKSFSATINVNEAKEENSLFSILTRDNEVLSDESIDFAYTSNGCNDNTSCEAGTVDDASQVTKGLYRTSNLSKTEDIDGDGTGEEVLYFRGAVENNYLIFADYCWRIVRTNEDGSVKLRYGGEPDASGYCPQTGTDVKINNTTYAFNTTYNAAKYMQYVYDTNTSSTAKTTIDTWYASNIANKGTSVTNLIADTPYCNDTTTYTPSDATSGYTYYGAYARLVTNKTPQYKCPQVSDVYTVSTNNGNGRLTYPIALLTADEVAYAGGLWNANNTSYYLYTGADYWTISPYNSSGSLATEFRVNFAGTPGNNIVFNTFGLVPAISLIPEAEVTQGTGEYNDPYIIG